MTHFQVKQSGQEWRGGGHPCEVILLYTTFELGKVWDEGMVNQNTGHPREISL